MPDRINQRHGLLDVGGTLNSLENEQTTISLGYDNLGFLFLILGAGIAAGPIVWTAEKLTRGVTRRGSSPRGNTEEPFVFPNAHMYRRYY